MEPIFDELAGQTFAVISNLMGVDAVWHSSNGGQIPGRVLFNNPTEPKPIGDGESYEYKPADNTAEYYEGTFTGLRETVDAGGQEYIEILGNTFHIIEIATKYDGKTYVAHLELHEEY